MQCGIEPKHKRITSSGLNIGRGEMLDDCEYSERAKGLWLAKIATHGRYLNCRITGASRDGKRARLRALARSLVLDEGAFEFVCQCAGVDVEYAATILRRSYRHPERISFAKMSGCRRQRGSFALDK